MCVRVSVCGVCYCVAAALLVTQALLSADRWGEVPAVSVAVGLGA